MVLDGLTLEEAKEMVKTNKQTMGSVIKWHTGIPEYSGKYIITYRHFDCSTKYITWALREGNSWYDVNFDNLKVDVLAWCPLKSIETYKE